MDPAAESNLIDTHCHLTDRRLVRRLKAVLARAEAAGVGAVVCAASDVGDSLAAAKLAGRHQRVYWTAGVHPHEAKDAREDDLRRLAELAAQAKNVAIGEIGLDYHYDFSPRDVQRSVFARQLDLARRLGKPVVIHAREALDDTLAVLAEIDPPGETVVFHSFTGSAADVRRLLDRGAYVGFSGIATFKNAPEVRQAAAEVGADRILVETDAPYLSPEPVRRMRVNEPANVVHVARCLAGVRGVGLAEFARQTTANARRVFGI